MPISLRVLKVDQPIGEFYIGAIDSRVLNSIATVEVREFLGGRAQDIGGIQRQLSSKRVNEISEYVNFDYATFPTSVIIAIDERNVRLSKINSCDGLYELVIDDFQEDDGTVISLQGAALIIDGQHRLAGLKQLSADSKFELNVSIFIGADIADKAEIFSTVNLAQTKVNKSLVYDLFDYASKPSPFKVAHDVVVALDSDVGGPLEGKIKRLGIVTPGRDAETLSQATVVEGILRHLPPNPSRERNKGFLGLSQAREPGESWQRYIFAPFYRSGDSSGIFAICSNYFSAVQLRWPTAWDDNEKGFILNRTNGYNALIRFLQDVYVAVAREGEVPTTDSFFKIFESMNLSAADFNTDNFKPGSSGASELYKRFLVESQVNKLL